MYRLSSLKDPLHYKKLMQKTSDETVFAQQELRLLPTKLQHPQPLCEMGKAMPFKNYIT